MKEALRTSGTSSRAQAGALGMLGADGVLVRVSAIVGRGLADAVFVVVIGRVDVVVRCISSAVLTTVPLNRPNTIRRGVLVWFKNSCRVLRRFLLTREG